MQAFFRKLFILVTLGCSVNALGSSLEIQTTVDSVHFEFPGLNQWDYRVQKTGNQVILEIPSLDLKNQKKILATRHPSVKKISLAQKTANGKDHFVIQLTDASTEVFDYLTDDPARMILDLLPAAERKPVAKKMKPAPVVEKSAEKETQPSLAESVSEKSQQSKPMATDSVATEPEAPATAQKKKEVQPGEMALKKAVEIQSKETKRKPASDALVLNQSQKAPEVQASLKSQVGIFDGADPGFERFRLADFNIKEEAAIKSQRAVYIDFPMLKKENTIFHELLARKPVFSIAPEDTEENKQARLLLTLYQNKRHLVFNKTVEWFFEKYPGSQYEAQIRFMWADNLFQLWKESGQLETFDLSMLRYRQALDVTKNEVAIEWTLLMMGFATLDRGDVVGTLRQFEYHLRTRPQSPDRDVARLALAEAFTRLNQFELALKNYEEVEKNGATENIRQMATFLKPDVFFLKKEYEQAIQGYDAAVRKYPQASLEFPNAYFNKAAALFGQKKFKESLAAHLEFLKNFPSHSYAGYAMTRIGEILEALGAPESQIIGAYLETFFRYGQNPSALVARLHLLAKRMDAMKPKEVEKTIQELKELSLKSDLPQIQQFTTLKITDGYATRKEFERAIDELVTYYQKNPTTADAKLLNDRIVENINSQLRMQVDQGKFLEAMKWHEKYSTTWLKNSDRIDTQYDLARAYEQAGLKQDSFRLYSTVLNRLLSLKETRELKERQVFERVPPMSTLNLRLAASEAELGKWADAYEHLRRIQQPEKMTELEQIERVQLMASLLEKKNEDVPAERYLVDLIEAWHGQPSLVAEPYYQLGQLELKQKKLKPALESFKQVHQLMLDSGKVNADTHARSLEKIAQIQLELGNPEAALQAFETLLNTYEQAKPLASVRYRMGQIAYARGDVKKASKIWNDLKGPQGQFWSKLAQEQLQEANWNEENKKYLKRIPAMSERSSL